VETAVGLIPSLQFCSAQ